jgi:nucleoside-diphosphate-sugar epimerase
LRAVEQTGRQRFLEHLESAAHGGRVDAQHHRRSAQRALAEHGGPWSGELSAVPEMMYQWRAPFTVDDSRFRAAFGAKPTPVERALTATLRAYGIETQPTAAATAHAA